MFKSTRSETTYVSYASVVLLLILDASPHRAACVYAWRTQLGSFQAPASGYGQRQSRFSAAPQRGSYGGAPAAADARQVCAARRRSVQCSSLVGHIMS